jgi:hypothetical protein
MGPRIGGIYKEQKKKEKKTFLQIEEIKRDKKRCVVAEDTERVP